MIVLLSRFVCFLLVLSLIGLSATVAQAQRAEVFQSRRPDYTASALAVGGFDTVAYHTQQQAVSGRPEFRVSWKGAEWQFASQANRDAFAADPEKFAPQYGGYCAFAVAGGSTAAGDPRVFDVVNGRLYLNLSTGTQASWRRGQASMIQRGDQNWPRLIGK